MRLTSHVISKALLAVLIAPALSGAPAKAEPFEAMCSHQGLVAGTIAPRTVGPKGTFVELATALGKKASTEDAAVNEICAGSSKDSCNASMKAFAVVPSQGSSRVLNVYVRSGKDGSGPWLAFDRVAPSDPTDESESISGPSYLDGGRYVHFSLTGTDIVWAQQEGELDSERFGAHTVDIVIDREKGRHAWSQTALRWGTDVNCDGHVAPTASASGFTRTDCAGEVDQFTAADVAECTPAKHGVYLKHMATNFAKKKAHANRILIGRPLAGANTAEELVQRGRKLTKAKDYDTAIVAFSEAYDKDPNYLEAISGLGYAKLLRAEGDDLEEAIACFDEARQGQGNARYDNNPKFFGAVFFNLGLAYEKLGNDESALENFVEANRLNPSDGAQAKIKALKKK